MNIDDYQVRAIKHRLKNAKGLNYSVLGLCGESGEVADKVKKQIRDGNVSNEDIVKELGDVLWYCAAIASDLNTPLSEVLKLNIKKIEDRVSRGKIQGSGDNR